MAPDRETRPPARRVARNTVLRAAAEIVGKLASIALFAYVARALGSGILGEFVFALALTQIVWSLAGFGFDRMALRDIARDHRAIDRLFWDMFTFKLAAGLVGIAAAAAIVALAGYSGRVQALVAILGLAVVLVLVSAGAQAVFQAYERMEYYFYAAVPNKVLAALLGIGVLLAGGGIVAVAAGQLVAAILSLAIALWFLYRNFARPRVAVRPRAWPRLARDSAPFGMQEVLGQVIFRIDIVILSLLTTSAVVGAYGAGYRLLEATLFLAWSVGTSVLPMYSYLARDGQPSLGRVFEGSLKFVAVIVVPVAVAFFLCARGIVDAVYGLPEYETTVAVLRWLAFALVAYSVGHLAGILVLVRRPGRLTVIATGVVAVFNVALNLVLIPRFGAEGAAAATLATELLLAAIVVLLARPVAGTPNWLSIGGGATLGAAAMVGVLLPLDGALWALPLALVAYLLVLAVFEARSLSGDLAAVREVLSRRGSVPAVAAEESPPGPL